MLQDESLGNLFFTQDKSLKQEVKQTQIKAITFKEDIHCLQIFEDTLYVGTNESKVLIYDLIETENIQEPISMKYVSKIYPHCASCRLIKAVEKHLIIVPQSEQQLIRIWDRKTHHLLHGYQGHEKQITQVIFLKGGQYMASSSEDATVRIWDIYQHDQFDKELVKYDGSYPLIALEEIDQHILAFGGDSCFITIWNWKTQEVNCKVFGHPGSVQCLAFYAPHLVSTGGDAKLKIWEIDLKIGPIRKFFSSSSNQSLQGSIVQVVQERHKRFELCLWKEIKGDQMSPYQFFFKFQNYHMFIVDSTGNIFHVNPSLAVKELRIEVDYFRKIKTIKLWKNYMIYYPTHEKKQKKYLHLFRIDQKDIKQDKNTGFIIQNNTFQLITNLFEVKQSSNPLDQGIQDENKASSSGI